MLTHEEKPTKTRELKICPMPYIQGEARIYASMSQPFAAHSHDHYVVGVVRKGTRMMICNAKNYRISEGNLIIFNPGDVHECKSCEPHEPMIFDSITFSKSFAGSIRLCGPVLQNDDALNKLDLIFASLGKFNGQNHLDSVLDDISEIIMDTVAELIDILREKTPLMDETPSLCDKKMHQVKAYIEAHFAEPISIDQLAKELDISTYALIRAYRKRYSITPFQDLISLRVNRACKLLSLGIAPCEVAEQTGFCDQAHLTRVFKKRIGTTPAAYAREAIDCDRN